MPVNARGRHSDFALPDPTALGLTWPELQQAIDTHARLVREQRLTGRRLGALEEDHRRAVAGDRTRLKRAIKEGKPEPEPKATQKVLAEIAGANRRMEALAEAIEEAEGELVAVVEEHRGTWAEETAERIVEDRARYAEAIERLALARDALMNHFALAGWLRTFPEGRGYRPSPGYLSGLTTAAGEPYSGPQVIAALRAEANPAPEPVAIPPEVAR